MKFSTRELVTLAVFGALWGMLEISLGSVLHSVRLPFSGLILTALGLAVAMTARTLVPRRGSTIFIGVIAMVLKVFSIGNIIIGPMIGILAEALVAEIVLDLFPRPTLPALLSAGAAGALWTLIQPFVTGLLFYGRSLLLVWLDMVDLGTRIFRIDSSAAVWIAVLMIFLNLAVGSAAGLLAWQSGKMLSARLGNRFGLVKN